MPVTIDLTVHPLISRILRDIIYTCLGLGFVLFFVHEHVTCDVSGILGDAQIVLFAVSALLSLATRRFGWFIVAVLLGFIVPAVTH